MILWIKNFKFGDKELRNVFIDIWRPFSNARPNDKKTIHTIKILEASSIQANVLAYSGKTSLINTLNPFIFIDLLSY